MDITKRSPDIKRRKSFGEDKNPGFLGMLSLLFNEYAMVNMVRLTN